MSDKSNQQIGKEKAILLVSYIRKTPIESIPRNQFKACSRRAICEELGISYSTIATNSKLQRLFDFIDRKLKADPGDRMPPARVDAERRLQNLIRKKEARIEALMAENKQLKQAQLGKRWVLKGGRMIRP